MGRATRSAARVVGVCTLVSCGGQPPAGEAACAAEVATRLEALGVDPQSGETRSGPDGSEIHFPEQPRGAHVSVAVLEGAPVVTLRSPEGVSRWHFADGCHEPRMTVSLSDLPVEGARFTDADLEAARRAHPGGVVVYAWSPHMPLSVDGLPEVAEAARDAGFGFEPVLIAPGDTSFARAELLRVGGPEAALRRIASVELLTRELQVHAPALLVFSADRVSPVLPGYRNAEGYRRFLEAFVEGR